MNKAEYRRARLQYLLDTEYEGIKADLIRAWDEKNPDKQMNQGELSSLLKIDVPVSERKSFGEKKSHNLAKGLGLRLDYFEDDDPNISKIVQILRTRSAEYVLKVLQKCTDERKPSKATNLNRKDRRRKNES